MRSGFPLALPGQTIGLFGGSFDPPHAGHLLAAKRALRRADLDQIWWIPSPGNPLKKHQPAPIEERINKINAKITDPRMKVADVETQLGTRYTIDTLRALQTIYPGVNFVLVFGADILGEIHRWRNWRNLAKLAPILTIARPGEQISAGLSPFAQSFARYRLEVEEAPILKYQKAPAWVILPGVMSELSSTQIRAAQNAEISNA